jgi:hypothetical protein
MFCHQTPTPLKLPDQRRQYPLLPPLWAEVRHRVAFRGRQRQQIGDEWFVSTRSAVSRSVNRAATVVRSVSRRASRALTFDFSA